MAKFRNGRQRRSQIPNPPKSKGIFSAASNSNGHIRAEITNHADGVVRYWINGKRVSPKDCLKVLAVQECAGRSVPAVAHFYRGL